MDAVIYIRWSSTEQTKGNSLQRQQEDCRRHAAMKGWKVGEELVDDGISAFRGRHVIEGKLGKFVADVESGRWPDGIILLVEKLDRLSRQEAKVVFLWMVHMTELGVVIATIDGDRRYDKTNIDMNTIIEVVVKAQLSNEESQKKSERIAAAWAGKRARLARGDKIVMTRRAPAWLTVKGNPASFVVIENRAAIVRRIFEETTAGFGKHHIARNLNRDRVDTFGRADAWHASYIQKILRNTAVLGEFQPGQKARGEARTLAGDVIKNYYPAVVDADLHARALTSMRSRQRKVTGKGRTLVNLFSGLATCRQCAGKMTFRSKGLKQRANGDLVNEDYLVCDTYQRGRGCTNNVHFNYSEAERGVLDAVLAEALDDRHFAAPTKIRSLEIALAERTRSLEASKSKAARVLELFLDGDDEAKTRRTELIAETKVIATEITAIRERIVNARGAVTPADHLARIAGLRVSLNNEDEDMRFEARSKVMAAVHDLVVEMEFYVDPRGVTMKIVDGRHAYWFADQSEPMWDHAIDGPPG